MTKSNFSVILTGIVIAVCFYLYNLAVPYYSDDWWYNFIHESDYSYPSTRIENVGDIVTSQINHYQTVNGRLPVTTLVQYVVTFIPKSVFNLLNTAMFMIACLLLIRNYTSTHITARHWILTSCFLFFLMPGHYDTLMWATGAINYLWVGTFILFIMLLWQHLEKRTLALYASPLLFIIGFMAGWSNEALSFGLAAGVATECVLRWKRVSQQQRVLAIGIIAGSCMILLAPGSWNRMGGISWNNVTIYNFIPMLGGILIPLVLAIILLISYCCRKEQCRNFIAQYRIWLIASLCLLPVCLLTYQYNARSFYGTAMFASVPLLAITNNYISTNRRARYILYILACVMIITLGIEHNHVEQQHRTLIELYSNDSDGVISLDNYKRKWYAVPYTIDIDKKYHQGAIPRHMAAYYQKDSLQWISTALYQQLTHPQEFFISENKVPGDNELYTTDNIDCYVLKPECSLPDSLQFSYSTVSFHDEVPLPSKMRRLIAPDSYPMQATLPAWLGSIRINNQSFIYINKNHYRNEIAIDYCLNEK